MRFMIWIAVFTITSLIGIISFFSENYAVWFIFLIVWIISIIKMLTNRNNSKSIVEYPNQSVVKSESTQKRIEPQITKNTTDMASFTGGLQDFYDIVLPKIRNSIASMTKKKKIELEYICQHCHQKNELDSAHIQGRSLRDIVRNVLEYYKIENGKYTIPDIHQVILKIKGEHVPIENSFLFLCKECHRKYDGKSDVKNKITHDEKQLQETYVVEGDEDYRTEFLQLLRSNDNLKNCLKKLFVKFPDTTIKSTDLRKIWEKEFPDDNSQKVTDYLWNLEKEGILEKPSRANYKASKSIQNNTIPQKESIEINDVKNRNQGIIPQKGEEFTENELHAQFGVRNSGGIRPSNKNKMIILINSFFSEKQGGYKNEISEKSGFVYHVGEGGGNQEMKRNNKSILETKYNGYSMLYFDKPEQNRLFFRFQVEYDSHEFERQTNAEEEERDVIIFKLKIIK